MNIVFQNVLAMDIPEIQKLAKTIWREAFKTMISDRQIASMLETMYSTATITGELEAGFIWELIGFERITAGFLSYCAQEDATVKLSKLYILSEYRKKSIATEAIVHVAEYARTKLCTEIVLTVNKNNARAIKAYRKNGFEIRDSIIKDIGKGFVMDDYIMKLPVRPF